MDPVSIGVGAALIGGGLSATSTVMEGRERSRAEAYEAQNLLGQSADYSRQEQEYRIAAAQTEAQRRDELTSSLETIAAIRAGRGVGASSPTGMAILNNMVNDEERDVRVERLNYLTRAEQSRIASLNAKTASSLAKRKSRMSLIGSYVSAGADVANTVSRVSTARQGTS